MEFSGDLSLILKSTLDAFASRGQDWADVENVLIRPGNKLNTSQIFEELRPLVALKEDDSILPRLENLMKKRGVS